MININELNNNTLDLIYASFKYGPTFIFKQKNRDNT